ncbi:MAG: NAD-dependent isocitrate dehydrogenase, partial [candidate division Zixibacteria bacterium]|nr:NAD-dependent isocitrate dehydrogenase [candidate division Zixibacteria bacterium]
MSHKITLIDGDGIGPEVTKAVTKIIKAAGVEIQWEERLAGQRALVEISDNDNPLPAETIDSIRKNKVALKAPVTTPVGERFRSVNVALRKELDLYCNLRPTVTLPGVKTRYENIDLVVVRENTEDLYAGIERQVDDDTAESIKRITRGASERICRWAFEYARKHGRKKVTASHKANIMKLSDGLFLRVFKEVAAKYSDIESEDVIIDALCMRLVIDPTQFDVLVMPNLYGDIVSDLCSGFVGGLGVAAGANFGENTAVFGSGGGSGPGIAGQNKSQPTAR